MIIQNLLSAIHIHPSMFTLADWEAGVEMIINYFVAILLVLVVFAYWALFMIESKNQGVCVFGHMLYGLIIFSCTPITGIIVWGYFAEWDFTGRFVIFLTILILYLISIVVFLRNKSRRPAKQPGNRVYEPKTAQSVGEPNSEDAEQPSSEEGKI